MNIECRACHVTNSATFAWKFPAFKPDCAACHVDKFRPQSHIKYTKPVTMYYTAAELRDCTGACHIYTDNSMTTIVTRRMHMHRPIGGGW